MTKSRKLALAGVIAVGMSAPWLAGITQADEPGVIEFTQAEVS
jgi:hypothetical protein